VVDDEGNLYNLLSQMDVVSFLLARHNFLGEKSSQPMEEIGLVPSEVVGSLDEDTNVMAAMRYMRDCGVSGIAVTNKEGKIVTNFSATDVLVSIDLVQDSIRD
jgi:CBS domain-containing protein